jgi:glutathione synthase/RimK-type ligase-like ATP-grasp enzyme
VPCILIIGNIEDAHIASVCSFLNKQEDSFFVLNPHKGSSYSITYHYNPLRIEIESNGDSIDASDIGAVWWRLKPNLNDPPKNAEEFEQQKFLHREWHMSLDPLRYFLKDCFWINRRESDLMARNKPYQLNLAQEIGFKIPVGIISNNSKKILKTVEKFDRFIYKPLSYYILPPNQVLYSSVMSKEEVIEKRKNIEQAPCIFQQYLEKDFELRITIVGEKIFAVKIHSQKNKKTELDWRKDQLHVEYELFELPKKIVSKLLKLHRAFGLFYGAYDFIVDRSGYYHFLEVNPAGQWLWMEEILHLNISEQLAKALCKTASGDA